MSGQGRVVEFDRIGSDHPPCPTTIVRSLWGHSGRSCCALANDRSTWQLSFSQRPQVSESSLKRSLQLHLEIRNGCPCASALPAAMEGSVLDAGALVAPCGKAWRPGAAAALHELA